MNGFTARSGPVFRSGAAGAKGGTAATGATGAIGGVGNGGGAAVGGIATRRGTVGCTIGAAAGAGANGAGAAGRAKGGGGAATGGAVGATGGGITGRIGVGRDCRLTSDKYADALKHGLRSSGLDVVDLGMCPTPLVYFSLFSLDVGGAIQVTGSTSARCGRRAGGTHLRIFDTTARAAASRRRAMA